MSNLPLTYPDLVCEIDLDPFGSETTSDLQSLSQDVYHILIETPGSNPDAPERGVGILSYLGGKEISLVGLAGRIDSQLEKDDRVTSSKTSVTQNPDGTWLVSIALKVGNDILPLAYGVSSNGVIPQ